MKIKNQNIKNIYAFRVFCNSDLYNGAPGYTIIELFELFEITTKKKRKTKLNFSYD